MDFKFLSDIYFPKLEVVEDFSIGKYAEITAEDRDMMSQKEVMRIEQEEQDYFTSTRANTCYGGSDVASIMGVGFQPPSALARIKQGKYTPAESDCSQQNMKVGHRAETYIRHSFERSSGIRTLPWPLTMVNPKWPKFRMNIDGLVVENGKIGIYEGKWSNKYSILEKHYRKMKKLRSAGIEPAITTCPVGYLYQVWAYEAGMELDFGYLCGGWGFSEEEIGYCQIPRLPKEKETVMMQTCEEFMDIVNRGEVPADDAFVKKDFLLKVYKDMAMQVKTSHTPIDLPEEELTDAKRYLLLKEEVSNLQKDLDKEVQLARDIWHETHPELCELKTQMNEIEARFQEELMENDVGFVEDEKEAYKVSFEEENGKVQFDKLLCEKKYPEVFKEVYTRPKKRVLRVEKLERGD